MSKVGQSWAVAARCWPGRFEWPINEKYGKAGRPKECELEAGYLRRVRV
ncbi:MAG: hypothetical protein ACUVXJ_13950 [Phycisphaerae bacterium]